MKTNTLRYISWVAFVVWLIVTLYFTFRDSRIAAILSVWGYWLSGTLKIYAKTLDKE